MSPRALDRSTAPDVGGDPRRTGHYSVAFPTRHWYPACRSSQLTDRPVAIALMDEPLVVFRDHTGTPSALLDRCPHRNVPLSLGRCHPDGTIECGYHGWRFDGAGTCRTVPGLDGDPDVARRGVRARPTAEASGMVWVWADPASEPDHEPFVIPERIGPIGEESARGRRAGGSGEVHFDLDFESTMHAAIENALDVPHTAFLHAGVFRGGDVREVQAVRRAVAGGLEVQYLGEPVGLGRFRAGPDAELTFDHWDRFFLPSIAQIEYGVRGWLHILNTIFHLPLSAHRTRAFFVTKYWTRLPAGLARGIVWARGRQILAQDARMLAQQDRATLASGGEQFTSTELDLMGPAIWRLLRQAERNEVPSEAGDGSTIERTVAIRV